MWLVGLASNYLSSPRRWETVPGGDRVGERLDPRAGARARDGLMGYIASTSDTSGICGLHVLLGHGVVIRPRRIEIDEDGN